MHSLRAVLDELDLPPAELSAARLDGELFGLADSFVPVDVVVSPVQRARASLGHHSPRLIAETRSAAWIWGATSAAPGRATYCMRPGERVRAIPTATLVIRQLVLDPDDVMSLDGNQVTTPLRTAVDLARFTEPFDAEAATAIRSLAVIAGFGVTDCARLMDRRRNLHGKRAALERLGEALSRR